MNLKGYLREIKVVIMSDNKKTNSSIVNADEIIKPKTRAYFLEVVNDVIINLQHKAIRGKVKNPRNEKVKIDYYRALIYAINTGNTVLKDKQLDELEKDLELLKNGLINIPDEDEDISEEKLIEIAELDARIDKIKES